MARLWRRGLATGARELRTKLAPHIHLRRCVTKEAYAISKRDVTERGMSLALHGYYGVAQCTRALVWGFGSLSPSDAPGVMEYR